MNPVVSFEYEWMVDGSLRLRFLDRKGRILGQQIVAIEALLALHLLMCLAVFKLSNADPQALLNVFQQAGLDASFSDVTALIEPDRVCASVTPGGKIGINTIEDDA